METTASSGVIVTLHGQYDPLLAWIDPATSSPTRDYGANNLPGRYSGTGCWCSSSWCNHCFRSVLIMAASFMKATFDRLPLDEDEVAAAMQNRYHHNGPHHQLDISDLYGMPQT
ncbi:AT-hook motif nuclear-localized protein 16-like [Hibiscus syriacus]|nr:AT-hook motif nuclear-localized protein 16-like [Hibiscus syriacus]